MRYEQREIAVACGVLPTGSAVTVRVLDLNNDVILATSISTAVESPLMPGLYRFVLSNITTPITGFLQVVVEFKVIATGERDYAKILLRGYVDDVTKTRRLVGSLL